MKIKSILVSQPAPQGDSVDVIGNPVCTSVQCQDRSAGQVLSDCVLWAVNPAKSRSGGSRNGRAD